MLRGRQMSPWDLGRLGGVAPGFQLPASGKREGLGSHWEMGPAGDSRGKESVLALPHSLRASVSGKHGE